MLNILSWKIKAKNTQLHIPLTFRSVSSYFVRHLKSFAVQFSLENINYILEIWQKKFFFFLQLQTLEGLWDLNSSWSTLWEVMTWNKIQYYRNGLLFYNSCKRWICYKIVVLLEKQSKIKQAKKKTQTLSFGSWDLSVAYSGKVWKDYLQELKDGGKIVTESLKNDNPYNIVVTKKMVRFLLLISWMDREACV